MRGNWQTAKLLQLNDHERGEREREGEGRSEKDDV